jgi:cyclopropane-fatty-acyl-phospholipid synthase
VIFSGKVMHARAKPVQHRFSYPVYFYGFDVDELEELEKKVFLFGHNSLRPVSLRDRDYLLPGDGTLREKLIKVLKQAGVDREPDRIILVTSARVMHYVFNPVSFFYCYGSDGKLLCVVAQVNNTFGEMHLYLLSDLLPARRQGEFHFEAAKVFHVSPFFDRTGKYDFYFTDILKQDLDVILHYSQDEDLIFAARLTGTPGPLGRWTVAGKLLRHPLTASLTKARILWQAARLKFQKKLPVFHKPPPSSPMTIRGSRPDLVDRLGRCMIAAFFSRIKNGALTLIYPEGESRLFGEKDIDDEKKMAAIKVLDNAFFRRTLFHGGIGFGESWMAGEWDTGNLADTLAILAINLDELKERHHFLSAVGRTFEYTRHLLKPNTVKGSRSNIQAHYDLSNDFFALFLDRTLTYSSGVYTAPETTLEESQLEKLRIIIEKAGISATDHVLEIGCGWGSFAIQAAMGTGCRVTGITISREQLELARNRVREAGLEGQVELKFLDYRHLEGTYDKVVSIEMLEAVGHANLGTWFAACDGALKPGGRAVVQVITIPHKRYHQYRRSSDWIRKHIFPGGHLPSLEAMQGAVENHTTLSIASVERIGKHYARTLQDWDRDLKENGDEARALGFDEMFLRKWEYYFAYCQAGFETDAIDDLQIVLEKPGNGDGG